MDVAEQTRGTLVAAATARRMAGHYHAVELERLAAYARATEDDEFAYLEVATLLHISDRAAQARLQFARELTEHLPHTLNALRAGKLEEFKTQLIVEAVRCLTDEQASRVEDRVLDKAAQQTPGQLRAALTKAVIIADPEGAEQRRRERHAERRVTRQDTVDGQAVLSLHHSADVINAIYTIIRRQARNLRAQPDQTRTLEQLEADVTAELLLGKDFQLRHIEVHLTVPATSAAGLDDQPGEVEGVGAVTAQQARELLAEATRWRWIRTNPTTGVVEDLSYPRYTPPDALKKFVRVRDRSCRFPGCRRPARGCDLDHRVPWPLGPTCDDNCACLCRHHHRAKHESNGGWKNSKPASSAGKAPTSSSTWSNPSRWRTLFLSVTRTRHPSNQGDHLAKATHPAFRRSRERPETKQAPQTRQLSRYPA